MTRIGKMFGEVFPYIRHAACKNRSRIVKTWTDHQTVRTHRIYENCVSCNTKRFSIDNLPELQAGVDTYYCDPCSEGIAKIIKKYLNASPKIKSAFVNYWHNSLFSNGRF